MVLKRAKEIENSSANNETKGIICSMDSKTFKRILTLFCSKIAKEIKNGWPITKRKKLPAHWIAKPFKGFSKS